MIDILYQIEHLNFGLRGCKVFDITLNLLDVKYNVSLKNEDRRRTMIKKYKEIINNNDNITANSKQLEILKKNFPNCFDKNGAFISHKMEEMVGNSGLELSKESYSLNWLGKSYARLLANENPFTLLKEDKEHNSKEENKNSENLLIKGDNLEVLKHLKNAYSEQIKMIYIDPPYNTGGDGFVYNDDRKFSMDELSKLAGISLEEAKRILDFTQSKSNSHSAWLTFMYPRLYIARELLKDEGVIFISIDDNEVSQLKLLCDEVFGEENFVGESIRKTKSMTADEGTGYNLQHENLLIYSKDKRFVKLRGEQKEYSSYSNPDSDKNGDWKSGDPSAKSGSDRTSFKITNPYTQKIDYPPKGRYWAFSEESLKKYIIKGKIKFKKEHKENERGFIFKVYKNELKSLYNPVHSLCATHNDFMNQVGTKEIKLIFTGEELFENPKPLLFIQKIVQYATKEYDIILDFFAGSGTTAHAVMELNKDGGNRKYITVQIPEPIDEKTNKVAYDFVTKELKKEPTIFEITKERILKASKKIKEENPNYQADLGFKIYETSPVFDGYLDDMEELEEDGQAKLFDGSNLTEYDLDTLLTTWKVYDGMNLTDDLEEIKVNSYRAYYGDKKLYFMDKGFKTEDLKSLISLLDDTTNDFQPNKLILLGYNFESKAQRELKEALNNYLNKKSIELDMVIRY